MRKALAGLLLCLGLASPAQAQTKFTMPPPGGVFLGGYQVVTTCGTASGLAAGNLAFGAMDTTGAICTNASGGGGGSSSITSWGGGVLGAMANYGTSPGPVLVPGNNVFVTGSSVGATAGTTTTGALGSMVNCSSTTSAAGQTTGNQSYLNCDVNGGLRLSAAQNGGAATVKGGVGVVNGGSIYQAVAASQTATVLQSSTGATGDYLSHCTIYPTSTSPGVVTVFDNTNTAANSAILFPGGSSSVSNLVPFPVPVGANSINGAWKVTTGANVSVVCEGKFS